MPDGPFKGLKKIDIKLDINLPKFSIFSCDLVVSNNIRFSYILVLFNKLSRLYLPVASKSFDVCLTFLWLLGNEE